MQHFVVDKVWDKDGVFNIEEFDPDPFMDMLNQYGLPWVVDENPQDGGVTVRKKSRTGRDESNEVE